MNTRGTSNGEAELDGVVRGNDWRSLEPSEIGQWDPTRTVTVVMPCYMGQAELELTFAGLASQSYPSHLLEVVVVDDGSEPPIFLPSGFSFSAALVAQERDGFGLARARNLGAERAEGEILVFLDCDMVPERESVEAHARWHHVDQQIITVGFRHHAEFEGITAEALTSAGGPARVVAGQHVTSPQWVEFHMTRTRNLTSADTDLFRVASGGNLGISREFFRQVGGCDPSFRQWGAEDIEFGYRAFNRGAVLVPERKALAWHQGAGAGPDPAEEASLVEQRNRLSHLIAEPTFRQSSPGRSFEVPMLTVALDAAAQTFEEVAAQIDSVLASLFHDLVVALGIPDSHPDRVNLERQYGNDHRVVVTGDPLGAIPNAAIRLELPPRVLVSPSDVTSLLRGLKGHGVVKVGLDKVGEVRMATTRALSRAIHVGAEQPWTVAGKLFGERVMAASAVDLVVSGGRAPLSTGPSINPPAWVLVRKVTRKFTAVRSPADLATVIRWSVRGFRNVGRRARRSALRRRIDRRAARVGRVILKIPRWVQLAGSVDHLPGARAWKGPDASVELVLAAPDAPAGLSGATADGIPVVHIGEQSGIPLAAPVDHYRHNPAGFHPVTGGAEIELAPALPWPEDRIRVARSLLAVRMDRCDNLGAATRLVEFAVAGVPVVLDDPTGADLWLGTALAGAVIAVDPEGLADPTERDRASVSVRRAALAHQTLPARLRQLRVVAGLPVLPPPSVSVVVATNRPSMLNRIVSVVAAQDHPEVELVLALHGEGFGDDDPVGSGDLPMTVLRFPASALFGNVLSEASSVASGDWVAKMDDDDWYGTDHLTDLLAAADYSRADLVGKGSEFVYLEDDDLTIRRDLGDSEVESRTLAGGTLLVRTDVLRATYGWRGLQRGVDIALIDDVVGGGGRVWRTHPFGYLLRRTSGGHTWRVDDRYFLRHADQQWDGQAFETVGVVGD
ncbi:MAG: glycosyltransferase [Actinomycetota bacterium]|nr:glycosyltransferase [Actinomycetota bacterium]